MPVDAEAADDPPLLEPEVPERVDGIAVRSPSDDELGEDGREADAERRDDVDDQEGGTAELGGLERELPDVPEADRAADGREDEPCPGCPRFTFGHVYHPVADVGVINDAVCRRISAVISG